MANWKRSIQTCVLGAGIVGGLLLAADAAHTIGYVATYAFAAAAVYGGFFLLMGLVLLIWRRTRWLGKAMAPAAILFYGSFVGLMLLFARSGVWSHEEMVRFGPDVRSDVVVLLRDDIDEKTTSAALDVLADRATRSGIISETMIVSVGKHEGYAFKFGPRATAEQKQLFRSDVRHTDQFWRTYEDIAPEKIEVEDKKAK